MWTLFWVITCIVSGACAEAEKLIQKISSADNWLKIFFFIMEYLIGCALVQTTKLRFLLLIGMIVPIFVPYGHGFE